MQPRVGFNWQPTTSRGRAGNDHGWRSVRRAGVRTHQRLCVPQHCIEHRQLVPVRCRDWGSNVPTRSLCCRTRRRVSPPEQPEPVESHGRGQRLRVADLRPKAASCIERQLTENLAMRADTSEHSATISTRRSTATRVCRSPIQRPARDPTRGSFGYAPTLRNPGTTPSRPALRNALATG